MKTLWQANTNNRKIYFFNSMTNIKNFDSNVLGTDHKSTDCVIYYIEYFKTLDNKNSL